MGFCIFTGMSEAGRQGGHTLPTLQLALLPPSRFSDLLHPHIKCCSITAKTKKADISKRLQLNFEIRKNTLQIKMQPFRKIISVSDSPNYRDWSPKFATGLNMIIGCSSKSILKYGSEEKGSWFYKCSILLGFIMSKKQERLRSETS